MWRFAARSSSWIACASLRAARPRRRARAPRHAVERPHQIDRRRARGAQRRANAGVEMRRIRAAPRARRPRPQRCRSPARRARQDRGSRSRPRRRCGTRCRFPRTAAGAGRAGAVDRPARARRGSCRGKRLRSRSRTGGYAMLAGAQVSSAAVRSAMRGAPRSLPARTRRITRDGPTDAPATARSREHPHHARGRRRVREAGDALLDRQGQLGHAAPGAQGVLSRRARRSRCCTSTRPGSSARCTRCASAWRRESGMRAARPHESRSAWRSASTRSRTARRVHTDIWKTEGLKQALDKYGFDAAFGGARRDEEKSRAKERIFSFRIGAAPLGPEEPAPRAVAPLQRAQEPGREHPRVPALELDRARHLAVHPPREDPDRAALLRRPSARWSSATAR